MSREQHSSTSERTGSVAARAAWALAGVILFPAVAWAGVCEDGGLEGRYLERCQRDVRMCGQRYHGRDVARCEQTAVRNGRSRQEADGARQAEEQAEQAAGAQCRSDAYTQQCFALREQQNRLCRSSVLVRFDSYERDAQDQQAAELREKLRAYRTLAGRYASFQERYGACRDERGVRCSLPPGDGGCPQAEQAWREGWHDYVAYYENTRLAEMRREVQRVERERGATVTGYNRTMDRGLHEAELIAEVNEAVDWIRVEPARVQRLLQQAREMHEEVMEAYERRIRNVRCPRPRRRGGPTRRLRRVTVEHLASLQDQHPDMRETVHQFGLMGPSRRSREPLRGLTHEDVPAVACVEQVREERTVCRIFEVTLRRTKPDGSGWGEWGFHSIGGGELMNCDHLR